MGPLGSGILAPWISNCERLGKMLRGMHSGERPQAPRSLTQTYFAASTVGQHLVTSCVLQKTKKSPTALLLQAAFLAPPATTLPSGVGDGRSECAA